MAVNAETWTLSDLINRVSKDLDLEAETFYRPALLTKAINSAITDCENIIVNEYTDYTMTYTDHDIAADDETLTIPSDLYKFRIRGLYFKKTGFNNITDSIDGEFYKIRKIALEDVMSLNPNDAYQYRFVNSTANGQQIRIYPPVRSEDAGTAKIRMWYIRHFARLSNLTDVLDVPYPEYILDHVRRAVMIKEGHPLLPETIRSLAKHELDIMKDMKFLADDDEDSVIQPNSDSLQEFSNQEVY